MDDMSDGGGTNDCGEDEKDTAEEVEEENADGVAGWAEAMAKILGKKTPKSSSILLKNKEVNKMKATEKLKKLEKKELVLLTNTFTSLQLL